jgi:hypothetical protein
VDPGPDWLSATDLAEYAYCPRASYYRKTYPDRPPTRSALAGTAYHARELGHERRVEEHPTGYWVGVAAGIALVGLGLLALVRP